jgi:hypothetical protein
MSLPTTLKLQQSHVHQLVAAQLLINSSAIANTSNSACYQRRFDDLT